MHLPFILGGTLSNHNLDLIAIGPTLILVAVQPLTCVGFCIHCARFYCSRASNPMDLAFCLGSLTYVAILGNKSLPTIS